MKINSFLVWLFIVLAVPVVAIAEDDDPVFVFNKICYAQVPDLDAIGEMALKLAWHPMQNEELEEFKPKGQVAKRLEGWDVQVGERLYRVGITKTELSKKMIETFPEFENGSAISCSVILDDQMDADTFMPNMEVLAGKEPASRDVPEDGLLSTMWAGGNDEYKVFLFAKTPDNGKGGLLNVLVLSKENS